MATRAEVERVVAAVPDRDGLLVLDGRMRTLAVRPPAQGGGARIVVVPPLFPEGAAPAARPGGAELGWLTPERRREVKRRRARDLEETRRRTVERRPYDHDSDAEGATAPRGGLPAAAEVPERPDEADAPTQPREKGSRAYVI
jgi:hypothetical protein